MSISDLTVSVFDYGTLTIEDDSESIGDFLANRPFGREPSGNRRVVIHNYDGSSFEHRFDDLQYIMPSSDMEFVRVTDELALPPQELLEDDMPYYEESTSWAEPEEDASPINRAAISEQYRLFKQRSQIMDTKEVFVKATIQGGGIAAASKANQIISQGVLTAAGKAGLPSHITENEWLIRVLLVLAPYAVHYGAKNYGHLIPDVVGANNVAKGAELAMIGNGEVVAKAILELLGPMMLELAKVGKNAEVITIVPETSRGETGAWAAQ